jgi:hypothetical protein
MGSQHFRPLAWTAVVVILLASAAPSAARDIPFFGKSVCKEEKQKLGNDERILRDRHQLAFDQCRAGAGGEKSQRCQDLKQQQKTELQKFQDQKKRTLDECKKRAEDPKAGHKSK